MKLISKAVLLGCAALMATLALGAASASADWTAASSWTGSGAATTFTINGSPLLLSCATSTIAGTADEVDGSSIVLDADSDVTFTTCTANQGKVDHVTPQGGLGWEITFTATDKKASITTPQVSIGLTFGGPSCSIIVDAGNSVPASVVTGTVLDVDYDGLTVTTSGTACAAGSTTSTFTGTYQLTGLTHS